MYPITCTCYVNREGRFNTFRLDKHICKPKYWNRKEMRKGRHTEAEEEERKVDKQRVDEKKETGKKGNEKIKKEANDTMKHEEEQKQQRKQKTRI